MEFFTFENLIALHHAEIWKAKILEVIDKYDPDVLWFDFGCAACPKDPGKNFWLTIIIRPSSVATKWPSLIKSTIWPPAQDVRFTLKGDALYATLMGWSGEWAVVKALKCLYAGEIVSVKMLGVDQELEWRLTNEALVIKTPSRKPCEHVYVPKILRILYFGFLKNLCFLFFLRLLCDLCYLCAFVVNLFLWRVYGEDLG